MVDNKDDMYTYTWKLTLTGKCKTFNILIKLNKNKYQNIFILQASYKSLHKLHLNHYHLLNPIFCHCQLQ